MHMAEKQGADLTFPGRETELHSDHESKYSLDSSTICSRSNRDHQDLCSKKPTAQQ